MNKVKKTHWWEKAETAYAGMKWAIEKYFPDWIRDIEILLKEKTKPQELYKTLNEVWLYLPDNKFNILKNPPGWREFVQFLENAGEWEIIETKSTTAD